MGHRDAQYMDFAGALKALQDGKKVRREAWFNKVEYLYLKDKSAGFYAIFAHWNYGAESDTYWEAGHHDYFAEDWVVVE